MTDVSEAAERLPTVRLTNGELEELRLGSTLSFDAVTEICQLRKRLKAEHRPDDALRAACQAALNHLESLGERMDSGVCEQLRSALND